MAGRLPKSGRRHNSKTSQLRLDPFTIFIDENHSKTPHILRVLSEHLHPTEQYVPFESCFDAGTPDEDWLPTVGRKGWILLSADSRLWRRAVLREALFDAGVRAFIFTENTLRGETRAEILRRALPEMRLLVKQNPPPFVASLTVDGHARLLYDAAFHLQVLRKEKRSRNRIPKRSGRGKK